MRKITFLLPAVVVGALIAFAGCSDGVAEGNGWKGSADRPVEAGRGRAVETMPGNRAIDGENVHPPTPVSLTQLEGKLVYDDPEWFLDIGSETVALHLGNRPYLESLDIDLEEGSEAVAFGIMEEDGLSVVRITTEEGEIALRSNAGVPLWAGNANRGQWQAAPAVEPVESDEPLEGRGYQRDSRSAGEGFDQGAGQGAGRGSGSGKGAADQGAGQIGSAAAQTSGLEQNLL